MWIVLLSALVRCGFVVYGSEDNVVLCVKGAVCRILTLLKHKNTIICLQIFKKHVKLTYLFI